MGHALGNNYGKMYSFQSKPVWLDGRFTVASSDAGGLGVTNVSGQGIKAVYMYSTSPAASNPNPASGYAIIQFAYNYKKHYGPNFDFRSPVTGSALAINSSALTVGLPYQIVSVGAGPTGAETIAPVADVSGSLAGTWFRLYDAYGNTFIVWFQVSGAGSPPANVSGTLVPVQIASGATAAQVGTALVTVIGGLTAQQPGNLQAPAGVFSFTASGTTTVTLTSTLAGQPLPGVAADGTVPTGFTFALTAYGTNTNAWQKVGLPPGIVPAVNQSFIAKATGYSTGGGSTGTVKAIANSGITSVEYIGALSAALGPIPMNGSPNVGGNMLVQFLAATSSSVTTLQPTAPVDGTIVEFKILLEEATPVGGNNE